MVPERLSSNRPSSESGNNTREPGSVSLTHQLVDRNALCMHLVIGGKSLFCPFQRSQTSSMESIWKHSGECRQLTVLCVGEMASIIEMTICEYRINVLALPYSSICSTKHCKLCFWSEGPTPAFTWPVGLVLRSSLALLLLPRLRTKIWMPMKSSWSVLHWRQVQFSIFGFKVIQTLLCQCKFIQVLIKLIFVLYNFNQILKYQINYLLLGCHYVELKPF